MKLTIKFVVIAAFSLLIAQVHGAGVSLSQSDLDYYKEQNTIIVRKLGLYFDKDRPGYHSSERENALYLVDALTHYPSPHDDALKEMFLNRYQKALNGVRETQVNTGAVIWNVYNLAYVVKTKEITIAFDLIRLPQSLRKDGQEDIHKALAKEMAGLCDILFVSHIHGDHADAFVAREFLKQNKPVIAPPDVFAKEDFFHKVTHWPVDGVERKFTVPNINTQILLRIYPGHQAITPDTAVNNNFTVITAPNKITVAHSGDQSWKDDFKWLDTVHEDVDIDVLMINSWTASPDRVVAGLRPKIVLPGHTNEMGHTIKSRVPYWKSYLFWQNNLERAVHLFWGEPYRIAGKTLCAEKKVPGYIGCIPAETEKAR